MVTTPEMKKPLTTTYPFGWRHVVTFMAFMGFFVVYSMQVNLCVALVVMINQTALDVLKKLDEKTPSTICPLTNLDNETTSEAREGRYVWDTESQGIVLGSIFYLYMFMQIPGGWIAGKYGAKWVLAIGVTLSAVLTLLTPAAAEIHIGLLITVRMLEGLCQGVTWPAMTALFSRWAPPNERSKLPAFAAAGCFVGTPITFILSGVLADSNFLGGWPSIFYVFGTVGCLWFVFWVLLVSSSPADHKYISSGEKAYIINSLAAESGGITSNPGFCDVPWKKILTSTAVWACVVAHFTYDWGLYVLLTGLPTYFKTVLGFNIQENGFLSALPYICQAIIHMSSGQLADMLRTKFQLRTVVVRKIFDCAGHFLPGIFIIAVGYVGCKPASAVALLILCVGCSGFCGAGFLVNFLDIAPQFPGIIFGFSNAIGTIPGIIAPYITGYLTKNATFESWRIIFYLVGANQIISGIVYAIFAQGTPQSWSPTETPLKVNEKRASHNPSSKDITSRNASKRE